VQALGCDFETADLTGACIESWNIDATTNFRGVQCRYIFLLERADERGSRKRRPADPERTFEPGEFEKLYAKVLEQMEILLKKGLSPDSMRGAFRELQEKHPDVRLNKLEDRDTHVMVGLAFPPEANEADVDQTLFSSWETRYRLATAQNRLLTAHYQDLKEIVIAASAAGVNVQLVGGNQMEDKSIHVRGSLNIQNSQLGSLTGDVHQLTQTLSQAGTSSADLGGVLDKLVAAITDSKAISAPERHEAVQQVATVAEAAKAPKDAGWQAAAGKALDRLTAVLGKAPDLVKLVEVTQRAWEAVTTNMEL
jgi:hypothetical protein